MKLYIKFVDGQLIDHPATEINLFYAFGNEIPPEYIPFNRVFAPVPEFYEVLSESSQYVYDPETNTANEVWTVTEMTEEQKQEKRDRFINAFRNTHPTWTSWEWSDEHKSMQAPTPCPEPSKEEIKQGIGFDWIEGRGWIRHKMNEEGVFAPIE
jgi:hypothetical protein